LRLQLASAAFALSLAPMAWLGCNALLGNTEKTLRASDDGGNDADASIARFGKVDILFMIDNAASMGDKQALLQAVVPEMLDRFIDPFCVDANGVLEAFRNSSGGCPTGTTLEFQPVHDLHVGIVTSALGGRGADPCPADARSPVNPSLSAHNDDQGHLVNRAGDDETPVSDAVGSNFLAWFPSGGDAGVQPAVTDPSVLKTDLTNLVSGVHNSGCGYQAQLESFYRFLVQPDPYASVALLDGSKAEFQGVDGVLLQQRHDFLRPDSAVLVVVLSSQNDESFDPRSLGREGWAFYDSAFPSSPNQTVPRGTAACADDAGPYVDACTSCLYAPDAAGCQQVYLDPADDNRNIRSFHQKQRFGVDVLYPIQRYVDGLTSDMVPNRDGEHGPVDAGQPDYTANCSNPLFAATLPTDPTNLDALCHLDRGPRQPAHVFLAVIGGVPLTSLQATGKYAIDDPAMGKLSAADWITLLGNDPTHLDLRGLAVPYMVESDVPRDGIPGPDASDNADPVVGRDWNTQKGDLEYACTFATAPRDCTAVAQSDICDCLPGSGVPLCDPQTPTKQVRGKAYPTIRELEVARRLPDDHGITRGMIHSLCPDQTVTAATDLRYGYRPAAKMIVDRMRDVLVR
jgi:hypothetical protein